MTSSFARQAPAVLVLAAILPFAFGCNHISRLGTNPEGALILVNGMSQGESPAQYKSRSGFPETFFVEITKKGYKKQTFTINSAYRADLSLLLLIPGILPYFFSARLEDDYNFQLIAEDGDGS